MNRTSSSGCIRLWPLFASPPRDGDEHGQQCALSVKNPAAASPCSLQCNATRPTPRLAQSRHCVQTLKGTLEHIARPPLFGRRSAGGAVRGRGCSFSTAVWCYNLCWERQGSRDPGRGPILLLHVPNPPETRSQRLRERHAVDK